MCSRINCIRSWPSHSWLLVWWAKGRHRITKIACRNKWSLLQLKKAIRLTELVSTPSMCTQVCRKDWIVVATSCQARTQPVLEIARMQPWMRILLTFWKDRSWLKPKSPHLRPLRVMAPSDWTIIKCHRHQVPLNHWLRILRLKYKYRNQVAIWWHWAWEERRYQVWLRSSTRWATWNTFIAR